MTDKIASNYKFAKQQPLAPTYFAKMLICITTLAFQYGG